MFLHWLRRRPNWKEIVRLGATHFATTFITLKSIYDHNHDLKALVIYQHFISNKLSKTIEGRTFHSIVLDSKFWDQMVVAVKVTTPIIRLLHIVDSDEKPYLGYIYMKSC